MSVLFVDLVRLEDAHNRIGVWNSSCCSLPSRQIVWQEAYLDQLHMSRCADHLCTPVMFCELHSNVTHPSWSSMYKNPVPFLDVSLLKALKGRERYLRDGASFSTQWQIARKSNKGVLRYKCVLSPATCIRLCYQLDWLFLSQELKRHPSGCEQTEAFIPPHVLLPAK